MCGRQKPHFSSRLAEEFSGLSHPGPRLIVSLLAGEDAQSQPPSCLRPLVLHLLLSALVLSSSPRVLKLFLAQVLCVSSNYLWKKIEMETNESEFIFVYKRSRICSHDACVSDLLRKY